MSILWTTLRLPNLSTWACCGLIVCVLGVENPDLRRCDRLPVGVLEAEGEQGAGGNDAKKSKNKPVKKSRKNNQKISAAQRHFLGFELPIGNSVKLDERQRFEIVPALSRVGVDLNTPIGSVTAKSSRVSGGLVAAPKSPDAGPTAWLVVKTATLCTGDQKHDAMIHDALEARAHPEIRFTLRSFTVTKMGVGGRKLTGTASCTMWICGQALRLRVPVEVHQGQAQGHGQLLVVKGEVKLKLSEMGVKVPRTFGIPLIYDEITLWLGVRGRHLGLERHHKEVADAR